MVDDYLERFGRTGRALGLGPARVVEVEVANDVPLLPAARQMLRAVPGVLDVIEA